MNWKDNLLNCSSIKTLTRAQSALGRNTRYQLGAGGIDPTEPLTSACDCSGFIAWSIGIPRELPPGSDRWLFTDCIWSGGAPVKAGLFTEITLHEAKPGDLLVYPHSPEADHGHVALILETRGALPTKIIHCSQGNYRHYFDAIRITDPAVFLFGNHPTRAMQINYPLLKELATRPAAAG